MSCLHSSFTTLRPLLLPDPRSAKLRTPGGRGGITYTKVQEIPSVKNLTLSRPVAYSRSLIHTLDHHLISSRTAFRATPFGQNPSVLRQPTQEQLSALAAGPAPSIAHLCPHPRPPALLQLHCLPHQKEIDSACTPQSRKLATSHEHDNDRVTDGQGWMDGQMDGHQDWEKQKCLSKVTESTSSPALRICRSVLAQSLVLPSLD